MTLFASPVEWAFAVVSTILVGFTAYALREAIVDQAFLVANKVNGPRAMIADQNIREEAIKLGIGVVMLSTSIVGLFLAPPPPPYSIVPQSLISTVAWCFVAALMVLSSTLSKSVRRKLQRYTPVEVQKTVATLPVTSEGHTNTAVASQASEQREGLHVRKNERKEDRAQ